MLYTGRSILVSSPLGEDYKIDARLKEIISLWEYTLEKVEAHHPVSPSPEVGRDMAVSCAKYRIPHPTHILFLDADVVPRKNTLDKLMKMDVDIAMGVYPTIQNGNIRWSVSREEPYKAVELEDLPRNQFKIKSSGFGVTLIKYEVFEALEWPYWKNIYKPGGIEMGEDIYFCDKAREAGYDIWCDPSVKCNHRGLLSIVKNILIKKGVKQ
jgi:GT2 family glycosyltransferase